MKKSYKYLVFFIVVFFFFSNVASAQTDTTKANGLREKLEGTVCSCISQKDITSIKTADDAQSLIMNCFTGGDALGLVMDYAKASGVDISNTDQLHAMGEKLGAELALNCPSMMKLMENVISDSTQYNKLMQDGSKH